MHTHLLLTMLLIHTTMSALLRYRYIIEPGQMSLGDAFGHEACRVFRDRLVGVGVFIRVCSTASGVRVLIHVCRTDRMSKRFPLC
jgi:hypothetical protein